jgi:hypothetical protein
MGTKPGKYPKTCTSKHITRQYFTIIRTVMNYLVLSIQLIQFIGEEKHAVQARVEMCGFDQPTTVNRKPA